MYSIICGFCNNEIKFENLSDKPDLCPYDQEPIGDAKVTKLSESNLGKEKQLNLNKNSGDNIIQEPPSMQKNDSIHTPEPISMMEVEPVEKTKLIGFSLTYEKTGQKINAQHFDNIVIGRTSFGESVLCTIPQISRRHCEISYRDGNYEVTDCNSTHGTFMGPKNIDCRLKPNQKLKDGELLVLGRERFQIKLHYKESLEKEQDTNVPVDAPAKKLVVYYECDNCGNTVVDFNIMTPSCPHCGASRESIKRIEKLVSEEIYSE